MEDGSVLNGGSDAENSIRWYISLSYVMSNIAN